MKLPDLQGTPKNPKSVFALIDKDSLRDIIWKCHGIITLVCCELDINYPQFYMAVRRYGLEDELKKAKEALISSAEATLYEALDSKYESTRIKAADTILKYSAPKKQQEITVKNGGTELTVKEIFGIEE